jgi:preprotein translocase SecE subunit
MPKDDSTWLNICYVAVAAFSAYVFFAAIETVGIETGWRERYFEWYPMVGTLSSLVLGAVAAVWLRWNSERHEYFLSAIAELRKVSWPSVEDTKKMTIIVVVVCGVFAVILAVFDIVWGRILGSMLA